MAGSMKMYKTKDLTTGQEVLKEARKTRVGTASLDQNAMIQTNDSGFIDPSWIQGSEVCSVEAGEALSAGQFVQVYDDAGTPKVRRADNTNSRPADGYVADSVASGAQVTVYKEGINANLTGLTAGQLLFLGTLGAAITTPLNPETGSNNNFLHQVLGRAISATEMYFEREEADIIEQL